MQSQKEFFTADEALEIINDLIASHNEATTPGDIPPPAVQGIVLSDEQNAVIDEAINGTANLLILGKAGVGKSTTIKQLFVTLDDLGREYICLAPTGVAAINVGGQTIHRLIGTLKRAGRIQVDLIVIDEISMARADLLDELDAALQVACLNSQPFGGVKMIFIGDPGQLPPVVADQADKEYIEDNYHSEFFFSARCFATGNFKVMELSKVFRQKDDRYPKMLNLIREGKAEKPVAWLNEYRKTLESKGVVLCSTNKDAAGMNGDKLRALRTEGKTFDAQIYGPWQANEHPADQTLPLKLKARVMIIKNIYRGEDGGPSYQDLCNGDVGSIVEFLENGIVFLCDRTGREHEVWTEDGTWDKFDSVYDRTTRKITREKVGTFQQLPVRLSWAITIHKSQGATIAILTIDLRRKLFAPGQAYVAFSRGVSLENLWIMGEVRASDIMVHPAVQDFLLNPAASKYVGIKPGSCFDLQVVEAPKDLAVGFDEMFK